MAKSRVLLATGDEWIANLIGAVLRDANLEVVEQPTGAASIEMLDRDPVDAIVVDAALPDDAAEFIGQLRRGSGPAAAAVVLLLAHADDSFSRMEALRAGADACLGRPFRADELGLQVLALIAMAHRCADAPRPRGSFPTLSTALRTPSLPPTSATAALMGDLAQVSLPTMLSLLELERRSGTMTVQGPKQTATLSMREGAAVRATLNGSTTSIIAVLRRVLRLKSGRFEFRPDDPGPSSIPPHEHSSIGALLIEAARLDDESPSRRSSMLPPPPVEEPEISFDVHEAPTSPTQLPVIEVPGGTRRSVRPSAPPARRPPGVAAAPSSPPPSRRPSKVPPAKSAPARPSTSRHPPAGGSRVPPAPSSSRGEPAPKAPPPSSPSRPSKPPPARLTTQRSVPGEVPDRIPNARVPAITDSPASPTPVPAAVARPAVTPPPAATPRPGAASTVIGVPSPVSSPSPASSDGAPADGAPASPVSGPPRPAPRPGPPRPRGA